MQTRAYRLCVRVLRQPDDPYIPLLAGDCAHCMRQALDHFAYSLAIAVNKADPPPNWEGTQFPITSSRTKFDGGIAEKIGRKKLMPTGLYDALEQLQPYHGGDRKLLGALHALDNLDKHRFPPLVAGIGEVRRFNIGYLSASGGLQAPMLGAIEDGQPILQYVPTPGSEQKFDWEVAYSVAFDRRFPPTGGQVVVPFLATIRHFIRDQVLTPLEAYL